MQVTSWRKSRKIKLALLTISSVIGITTLATTIAIKNKNRFKPSFFNYKSYMSDDNIEILRESFDYKEFDEINQFSNALINNKAAAGIGSDFIVASLIKNKLISKLNYSIIFNEPILEPMVDYDRLRNQFKNNPTNELKEKLEQATQARNLARKYVQLSLRKEIWEHLQSYQLDNNDELWEYFYPYYSQDMVVSYNINKVAIPKDYKNSLGGFDFKKYYNEHQEQAQIKNPNALVNVLKALSSANYNNWVITDSVRDNMLYASAYWPLPEGRTDQKFTGNVEENSESQNETYKILINSFIDLIKDGTGYDIRDSKHISLKGDGLEIVNDITNPRDDSGSINASIMYNGDAIDAYYSEDNYDNAKDGSVLAYRPSDNILLVDGLIISSKLDQKTKDKYIKTISQSSYSQTPQIILEYKELLGQNLVPNFDQLTDSNITQAQRMISELNSWKIWKDIKTKELSELDLEQESINNFINYYSNLLNLSNKNNSKIYQEFYDLRSNDDEDNFEQKVNYYPTIIENNLSENNSMFLDKISSLIDLNVEDRESKINDLKEQSTEIEKIIIEILFSDEENILNALIEYISDNEVSQSELKDLVKKVIAQSIAFIDLSNDDYIEDYKNLTNFNFINYVPTQITDYEIVYRNYFSDKVEGQDQNVINIYKIENTSNVRHKDLQPISDSLLSKITTYYFAKTKS
ncbi:hypothetical protein KQ876_01585 [Mycoplasma sp. CSL7491-lung]|uniref:hypothetical protein n=1 Tax=Mycoplasma sp. CSL7491-lung TaxID=549718 RepID=UPI001C10BF1C|nr:hypothetical protein [Mycoplasma sp. CSL7491-lung]MBU4692898.1 hypothetical protein [Mycoplasma sp. CSL7491-lung]